MKIQYKLNGRNVTEKEFRRHRVRGVTRGVPQAKRPGAKWPVESDTLGCHPKQIAMFEKMYADAGLTTKHDPETGCAIIRSANEMQRVAEIRGVLKC